MSIHLIAIRKRNCKNIIFSHIENWQNLLRFKLTPAQGQQFNAFFELVQGKCYGMFGDDIIGSVRRLGLITFRITMVLTALRITSQNGFQRTLTSSDYDSDTAMCISQQLISHTVEMFQQIQAQQPGTVLKKTRHAESRNEKICQFDDMTMKENVSFEV